MKTAKILLSLFIISTFIYSCGNRDSKPAPVAVAAPAPSYEPDTIKIQGNVIKLLTIDSTEYAKLPDAIFKRDTGNLIDDTMNVYRHDSTLVLRFENGDSTLLLSTPHNMNDNAVAFVYIKEIKELNSYFVENEYYESGDYSIWNKASGKETRLFGYPYLSPDKKLALCYNLDIAAQFTSNGFQLFEVGKDSLHLKWETQVGNWGPEECRWKDDHTIYIRAAYNDSIGYKAKYISLKLPEIK